jgi:hypothetical protein
LLGFKAMPIRPIEGPEVAVSSEELDAIEALEPVDYEEECAEGAGIAEAIRRVRRQTAVMRLAVLAAAVAVALVLAQPTTLEAIGVVAHAVR